ncbi:MAG TPA: HD-GYP domain-containing protein [Syntrophales bacterium]|nr:HD-GYP domain-containing protein [Syntrophales bacterium]HRV43314.1 HD-GYP domain-containing protein [Syntrophales bacterium]
MIRSSDIVRDKEPLEVKPEEPVVKNAPEPKEEGPGVRFSQIPLLRLFHREDGEVATLPQVAAEQEKNNGDHAGTKTPIPQKGEDAPVREYTVDRPAGEAVVFSPSPRAEDLPDDEAATAYLSIQGYMTYVAAAVRRHEGLDVQRAFSLISPLIERGFSRIEKLYDLTLDFGNQGDYYITHPINTMIYALRVGKRMGYALERLRELAVAALLHDVGIFLVPEAVVNKRGRLTDEEMSQIRRHPEVGVNILAPYRDRFPWLIRAVHQHHERENGQGYPLGITGGDIDEFAKIIGICDSYEAMTHHRPHRRALMLTESIKELVATKHDLFSPGVIKAFLQEISLYPVGSYVRLNNKNIGKVVATNENNPLKPVVSILYDDQGKRLATPRTVDLRAANVLNIEEEVPKEELPA